jgi:acyl phosphate:glycerol-3-phosphate acyltransferase
LLLVAILIVASYLVGSIPSGVIVGRLSGFDPRSVGSGNIGMANVARAGGTRAAALTFGGDSLKGLIPVLVARAIGFEPGPIALVALAAFIGSICSVFLLFRGGKGVGCSVGIWLGLSPLALAIALVAFVVVFAIWRIMSLSSMAAAISMPPVVAALECPQPYLGLAIVMTALILLRHRENIVRLIRGEESTFQPAQKPPG